MATVSDDEVSIQEVPEGSASRAPKARTKRKGKRKDVPVMSEAVLRHMEMENELRAKGVELVRLADEMAAWREEHPEFD